jgi:large subunit ribosomal protein L4
MPSANVYDMSGNIVRQHGLDSYVFRAPINVGLLHQVVTAQLVNRRQGNASTKTRAEVSGGNKKPYRQKGTGRARQGSTRAPHFRGGGTVFGPRPHAYERQIPRKVKRNAIRAALSDKAKNGNILLLEALTFDEPRTKSMLDLLAALPLERNTLVLMPARDENVILSARNIRHVEIGHVASINVVELLKHEHLVMPLATVDRIVEMFGAEADDRIALKRHPGPIFRKRARRAAAVAAAAASHAAPAKATPVTPAATSAPAATPKATPTATPKATKTTTPKATKTTTPKATAPADAAPDATTETPPKPPRRRARNQEA